MSLEDRIRNDVKEKIRSGEWQPGFRIPFEHELCVEYSCARATVSKALQSLSRDGLIERRRKAGSFVAHPQMQAPVLHIPDIGSVITNWGNAYRYDLIKRAVRPVSRLADVERTLKAKGKLLVLDGIHHSSREPFGREHRLISLEEVPDAARVDFDHTDPGSWLLLHIPWTDARHRISAVDADDETAAILSLKPGAACLKLERWTWRSGRGITYVEHLYPGTRYDLVAEFTP